jgi:DNA-binding PadR family transcriptional regulator
MKPDARTMERILELLGVNGHRWSGARIAAELHIGSGELYPALYRLEKDSIIKSEWESEQKKPTPRRRFYYRAAEQGADGK